MDVAQPRGMCVICGAEVNILLHHFKDVKNAQKGWVEEPQTA